MKVSIATSAFNEEGNVEAFWRRITEVMKKLPHWEYEIVYADNASTDDTVNVAKRICGQDERFKLIVNNRNFGHVRSPTNAIFACSGDVVISMVSDLQDPPELIEKMLRLWEQTKTPVIVAVRESTQEKGLMPWIRDKYYQLIDKIGEAPAIRRFTGFGLYEKKVIDAIREINDPVPYFRGLITQLGFERLEIVYEQQARTSGFSKNKLLSLIDFALLGITSMSKAPLRIVTLTGMILSGLSLMVAFFYLIAKLMAWDFFPAGVAPIMIMLSFMGSFQILALGLLGEYIGFIHMKLSNRPMVMEKERVNFISCENKNDVTH